MSTLSALSQFPKFFIQFPFVVYMFHWKLITEIINLYTENKVDMNTDGVGGGIIILSTLTGPCLFIFFSLFSKVKIRVFRVLSRSKPDGMNRIFDHACTIINSRPELRHVTVPNMFEVVSVGVELVWVQLLELYLYQ